MDDVKITSVPGDLCSDQGIARYFLHEVFTIFAAKLVVGGKYTLIHIGPVVNGIIRIFFECFGTQIGHQKAIDFEVSQVFPELFKSALPVINRHSAGIDKVCHRLLISPEFGNHKNHFLLVDIHSLNQSIASRT